MNETILFPDSATKSERQGPWTKIGEISDQDFGFNNPKEKTGKTRFSVRVILHNDNDEFCIVKSEKYGYLQIPGGGIEEGESIISALRRETEEETGYLIKDIKILGYLIEKREDLQNHHHWDQDINFVLSASPDKKVNTHYTEEELAEELKPTWIKIADFITDEGSREGYIKSYSGCFANKRDLMIAKFYKSR